MNYKKDNMTTQNKNAIDIDAKILKYWNDIWQSLFYAAYIITYCLSHIYSVMPIFDRSIENLQEYYNYKLMN